MELMEEFYLSTFHTHLIPLKNTPANISSVFPDASDITPCVPLKNILNAVANWTQIKHYNVFLVDVEGGELDVLQSVDWNSVDFDVIVIEVDRLYRPYQVQARNTPEVFL